MPAETPEAITRYFQAVNGRDLDAAPLLFTEQASVHDEGGSHAGRAEIRAWMAGTIRKYDFAAEPEGSERQGAETVVTARVSGTFPGSPIRLSFRFRLADSLIERLEIG